MFSRATAYSVGYSSTTVYVKLNRLIGKVEINTAEMIQREKDSRSAISLLGYDKYQSFEAKNNLMGTTGGQGPVYYEKYRWSCFDIENKTPEGNEIIDRPVMNRYRGFLSKLTHAGTKPFYFENTLVQSVIKFNGKDYFVKFHGEEPFKARKGSTVVVEGILEYQEINKNDYENF